MFLPSLKYHHHLHPHTTPSSSSTSNANSSINFLVFVSFIFCTICRLSSNVISLEIRIDDLTRQCEDGEKALNAEKRRYDRLLAENAKWDALHADEEDEEEDEKEKPEKDKSEKEDDSSNKLPEKKSAEEGELTQIDELTNNKSSSDNNKDEHYRLNSTSIHATDGMNLSLELSMVCDKFISTLNTASGEEINDELVKLFQDLESSKKAALAEKQRCVELEEQLVAISK